MHVPAADRYDRMPYSRCGRSGLLLPAVSLGLWQNFGHDRPLETSRAISGARSTSASRTSTSPTTTGRRTARPRRTSGGCSARTSRRTATSSSISTKAGYDMWPGPYGEWGSRKYLLASLDQSLGGWASTTSTSSTRTGSTPTRRSRRRWARSTPRSARARRSTSGSRRTRRSGRAEAAAILRELGTPLLIHQPSYSLLNRWIEPDLLDALGRGGRLHRLLAARPGHAHRQVPGRHPRGLARQPRGLAVAGAPHGARRSRRCAR